MRPITLHDFFSKLQDNGVDLKGCILSGSRLERTYRFIRVIGGNVQVRYGVGFKEMGHMTRGILITGVSLSTQKSGKRIIGTGNRNESIVVHFTSTHR